MQKPICKHVETKDDLQACFDIRLKVFVSEQEIPEELELDEYENTSDHFLVFIGDKPVSTGRMRVFETSIKFERIATLKSTRGTGAGRILMEGMQAYASKHYPNLQPMMHAQVSAIGFYKKLGWTEVGEEYLEDGILHKTMRLNK